MVGWFGRSRYGEDRGAALVEAALVMPLLIMLTVGIWATARAWNVHNTLDHAVREAARYGATELDWTGSPPPALAKVRAIADQELQAAAIAPADVTTVCINKEDAGTDPCPLVGLGATSTPQVAVVLEWQNYALDFVFFTINIDLSASAVARWEGT